MLICGPGEVDESPAYDAGAAVVEEFEVEVLAYARIELDAGEEVEGDGA